MSQTSLKQKRKNETGMRYSKDSLDADKRKESDKPGPDRSARLSTQGHPSCRRCLCAVEGTSPCHTMRIYIHMCLLWEQGRQITMIRGSQELSMPKTESGGYHVRNQWSRSPRSPSNGAPVDDPRSRNNNTKLPTSSAASSRTSSASASQHESPPQHLSTQPSPSQQPPPPQQPPPQPQPPAPQPPQQPPPSPTPPSRPITPQDSRPPTPPEPEPASRRSTKMYDNNSSESWPHSTGRGEARELREPREPREHQHQHPSPVTTEWKSYAQRRLLYPSVDIDRDCLSDLQQQQRRQQQREEEEEDEAYWASVRSQYEKTPSCSRPRPPKPKHAITIAVSSRALFNMVDDRRIYEEEGLEKYMEHQLTNENVVLTPGPAFRFVKALQHVNSRLRDLYPNEQDLFDIVLMTNNHAQVGVRLINSVNHYGLLIDRFCLTGGKSPIGYLKAYLTNLYLSADSEKVQEAIQEGIASATMFDGAKDVAYCDTQLRVAFDGDAVLFSDESEYIAKEHGLDKFFQHETLFENKPLAQGPLKGFLEDLGRLQKKFYAKDERLLCPIRTYLVTARSAASSGARVLKTLRRWGLEIDEALFLAGAPKGPILVKIRPHIFFDDQMFHIEAAQKFGTISAHVPYGISQKYNC
ncbi:cytosolic 5'-nucleotidase 1B isoform X4 [Dipodomys spectabilis]|uniref:cytosolic 5'-nucleotidase 1B isoform X4 n=1 Tax=Dipodomys spectabilis TaxID=105255 RepID=UPI001C540ED1|nr:cytosolic 5'-nucleotidase 1B isoform X4 [Dipodomys spectabilis]